MDEGEKTAMSKYAVVFWSGTGNTEKMAEAVAEGVRAAGGAVEVFTAAEFDPTTVGEYEGLAFGCPSMGSEELESDEFEPMFRAAQPALVGKRVALFGSYGWGGQSPDQVSEGLKSPKCEALMPAIKLAYKPSDEQLKKIEADVLEALKNQ